MPFSTHHRGLVFHELSSKVPQNLLQHQQPILSGRTLRVAIDEQHRQTGREKHLSNRVMVTLALSSSRASRASRILCFVRSANHGEGRRRGRASACTYLPEATLKTARSRSLNYFKASQLHLYLLHVVSFLVLPASAFLAAASSYSTGSLSSSACSVI
jgi:hypothetical protein